MEPLKRLDDILSEAREAFLKADSSDLLKREKDHYIGRKSEIVSITRSIGSLPDELKPKVGQRANVVRKELDTLFALRMKQLAGKSSTSVDLTLPGKKWTDITEHPLLKTLHDITDIFVRMGFSVAEGPDIESEYNNFDALNTPPDHPARAEQDTFYLPDGMLMRTHTSPVQIRVMSATPPPVKVIAPGRCYRRDAVDATHYFTFFQCEGLFVDRDVSMADLKGVLTAFARQIVGESTEIRFRPHFFPFTEPSVEYDFSCPCGGKDPHCRICKGTGWIEISGAGMVDPEVFRAVGYDPEKWQGFAFGMGVERIAMIRYGISDIRHFYENDIRLLGQNL